MNLRPEDMSIGELREELERLTRGADVAVRVMGRLADEAIAAEDARRSWERLAERLGEEAARWRERAEGNGRVAWASVALALATVASVALLGR